MAGNEISASAVIKVTADTSGATADIQELRKLLEGMTFKVKIDADTSKILGELKTISSTVKSISKQKVQIKVDTSASQKEIDRLTKETDKLKNTINAMQKKNGSSLFRGLDSGVKNVANTMQKRLGNTFKNINFSKYMETSSGSLKKALQKELQSINKQYAMYAGTGKKIAQSFSISDNGKNAAIVLKEANQQAQTLRYTLQTLGNGQQVWALKSFKFTALEDGLTKVQKLQNELNRLHTSVNTAMDSGKISKDDGGEYIKKIEERQAALQKLASQNYIMPKQFNDAAEGVRQIQEAFSMNKNLVATANQMQTLQDKTRSLTQAMSEFYAVNSRASNFKNGRSLQTQANNLLENISADIKSGSIKNLENYQKEFNNISKGWSTFQSEAKVAGKTGTSMLTRMGGAFKSIGTYMMTSLSFQYVIRGIKDVVSNVEALDSSLTDLKKVSEGSASDYNQTITDATNIAMQTGNTISDVVSSQADWSKLGYSLKDSSELARIAALYQNVGDDITLDTATTSLTSTLQGFNIEASQAESVIDKFNEVSNNYAISSDEIGEALQRSAASFEVANTDLSQSIALVTGTQTTLQDASRVGNMWKTVSARLRGSSTELEDMGEDTDGLVKSTSLLQDKVKAITGFDIMETDGETYKSIYDIVVGIGEVWEELSDIDQAALLEILAGKNQSNALAAALNNVDIIKSAYQTAEYESEGSAVAENEKYMDSIEGRMGQLKAQFQSFSSAALDSGSFKGAVSGATELLGVMTKLTDVTGGLGLIGIGGGIAALIKNAGSLKTIGNVVKGLESGNDDAIIEAIETFDSASNFTRKGVMGGLSKSGAETLKTYSDTLKSTNAAGETAKITSSVGLLTSSLSGLGTGILSVVKSLALPGLIIGGTILAVKAAYNWFTRLDRAVEQSAESFSDYQNQASELDSITSQIDENQSKIDELESSQENGKLSLADESELSTLKQQNAELERQKTIQEAITTQSQQKSVTDAMEVLNKQASASPTKVTSGDGNEVWATETTDITTAAEAQIVKLKEQQEELIEKQQEYSDALNDPTKTQAEIDTAKKNYDDLAASIEDQKSALTDNIEDIQAQYDVLSASKNESWFTADNRAALQETSAALSSYTAWINGYDNVQTAFTQLDSYFNTNDSALKTYLTDMVEDGTKASKALSGLGLSLEDIGLENTSQNVKYLNRYFNDLADTADSSKEKIKDYTSSVSEIGEAIDSANDGANYETFSEYLEQAKEWKEQGLTGTDEFKEIAKYISPDATSTKEAKKNWSDYYSNIKRYFTQDDDGNETSTGLKNFVSDINNSGKQFETTAEAAKELGISTEAFEDILGRVNDYDLDGTITAFNPKKITMSSEAYQEATNSLDELQTAYDNLSAGDYKEKLGDKLDTFQSQIDKANGDLDSLPKDIVINIKAEIDKAQIESQLEYYQQQMELYSSDKESSEYKQARANAIIYAQQYNTTAGQQAGILREDGSVKKAYKSSYYSQAESVQKNMMSLVRSGNLTPEQNTAILDQYYAIEEAQKSMMDSWANSGKDWDEWAANLSSKKVGKNLFDSLTEANDLLEKNDGKTVELEKNASNVSKTLSEVDGKTSKAKVEVDGKENVEETKEAIDSLEDKKVKVTTETEEKTKGGKKNKKGKKSGKKDSNESEENGGTLSFKKSGKETYTDSNGKKHKRSIDDKREEISPKEPGVSSSVKGYVKSKGRSGGQRFESAEKSDYASDAWYGLSDEIKRYVSGSSKNSYPKAVSEITDILNTGKFSDGVEIPIEWKEKDNANQIISGLADGSLELPVTLKEAPDKFSLSDFIKFERAPMAEQQTKDATEQSDMMNGKGKEDSEGSSFLDTLASLVQFETDSMAEQQAQDAAEQSAAMNNETTEESNDTTLLDALASLVQFETDSIAEQQAQDAAEIYGEITEVTDNSDTPTKEMEGEIDEVEDNSDTPTKEMDGEVTETTDTSETPTKEMEGEVTETTDNSDTPTKEMEGEVTETEDNSDTPTKEMDGEVTDIDTVTSAAPTVPVDGKMNDVTPPETTETVPVKGDLTISSGQPDAVPTVPVKGQITSISNAAQGETLVAEGVSNFTLGETPTQVPTIVGVANYIMGSHPTSAPTIYGTARYTRLYVGGDSGGGNVAGTAHAFGTLGKYRGAAKANGDWSVGSDQRALVGEIGREMIVRDGRYFTVNNPSMVHLKKNDIVFNHRQTEELLSSGKTSSFGSFIGASRASGTAFVSGSAFADGSDDSPLDKFKEWYEKLFDWIEIRLDRLQRKIDRAITSAENYADNGRYDKSASKYLSAIFGTGTELRSQQRATSQYSSQARKVLNKAASQFGWSKKKKNNIWSQIKDGTIDIKKYGERTREAISSIQDFYEKSLDAADAVQELRQQIREYINDLFDMREEEREAKQDRYDTYSDIASGTYANSAFGLNSQLDAANAQLSNTSASYDEKINSLQGDYSNAQSQVRSRLNTAVKSKAAKKSKKYKAALKRARTAVKSGKKVASSDLKIIKSRSNAVYSKLYTWNKYVDEYEELMEEAELERTLEQVSNTTEAIENTSEKYENIQEELEDKIDKFEQIANNATTLSDRNNALSNASGIYAQITQNAYDASVEFSAAANTQGEYITSHRGTTASLRKLKESNKNRKAVEALIEKVKSHVSAGETIPASELVELAQYEAKGYVTHAFVQACQSYVSNLEAAKQWEEAYEIAKLEQQSEQEDLAYEQFENIQNSYDRKQNKYETSTSMIEAYQDKNEALGYADSANYYSAMMANQQAQNALMEAEKKELEASLATLTPGSDQYWDAVEGINDLTVELIEGEAAIADYAKSIREIEWDRFDSLQDKISNLVDETDFLIELLSYKDLTDEETGALTDQGLAVRALRAQNIQTYTEQARQYGEAIAELDSQFANDSLNNDYLERREELLGLQRDSILAAQDEREALKDLVEDGYDSQLDAISDIIDKYKDMLSTEDDLYNYQKNVKNISKEIASYQKQLAAYQNDDSEETRQRIQSVQKALQDAQEDLQDTERDEYISAMNDMLDDFYDELEDFFEDKLDSIDESIDEIIASLDSNMKDVSQTIKDEANSVGYELSSEMETIWGGDYSSISSGVSAAVSAIVAVQNAINAAADKVASAAATASSATGSNIQQGADGGTYTDTTNKSDTSNKSDENTDDNTSDTVNEKELPPYVYPWKTDGSPTANDGLVQIGDKVTLSSGQVYAKESRGGEAKSGVGKKWRGKKVYVDNVSKLKDTPHPFHLSEDKAGKKDIGWVALSQLTGYSKGGVLGDLNNLAKVNGDDGVTLIGYRNGERILTPTQNENFEKLINFTPALIDSLDILDNIHTPTDMKNQTQSAVEISSPINIEFTLPNVQNYSEFMTAMQNDKKFAKMLTNMVVNPMVGKTSMGKNNIRF